MWDIRKWLMGTLLVLLAGCSESLPVEREEYAGLWRNQYIVLYIGMDGSVQYKKQVGNATTSINAPIKTFMGDDFEVGVGPFSTVFKVSKPPYRDGKTWKMVVDEQELTRVDASEQTEI